MTLELGETFLEAWISCPGGLCVPGKLELWKGSTKVAENDIPGIHWNLKIRMQGTEQDVFWASPRTSSAARARRSAHPARAPGRGDLPVRLLQHGGRDAHGGHVHEPGALQPLPRPQGRRAGEPPADETVRWIVEGAYAA